MINIDLTPNKNIFQGERTILLPECKFRFDTNENINKIIIGEDCMINCHFIFESNEGEITIGNKVFINGGTKLISRSKITIGNYVTIAWGCLIYDHNSHSIDYRERQNDIDTQLDDYKKYGNFIKSKNWNTVKSKEIIIKDNVWIGFDCVILNGVTIGEGAIIGARSVIREDVQPWTIVAGNPAVVIKKINHE